MNIIHKRKSDTYEEPNISIFNLIKLITEFFSKRENMETSKLYKLISYFYDIHIEENDYLDYVNSLDNLNKNNFYRIVNIPTEGVIRDIQAEGHGKDFSWWSKNYQKVVTALSGDFMPIKEEYSFDEIENLVAKGEIVPLYSFNEITYKPVKLYKDNLKYLVTTIFVDTLDENAEYFDYMVHKVIAEITLEDLINEIRFLIIELKLNSALSYYGSALNKGMVDKLISEYNKSVEEQIPTSELNIVMDYLKKLPNSDEWFDVISIDQIINIFYNVDEEDKPLCSEIEALVISVGDAELCYEMAMNFDWINKEKMAEIVIARENPVFNYLFAMNVEGADIEMHKQAILNSKFSDQDMIEKAMSLTLNRIK